jgi:hypothetical protein
LVALARSSQLLSTVCYTRLPHGRVIYLVLGIGCAGEIRISQHEDYEKWAIDILVKFRDSEKLQLLTAHRQSGGVRISWYLYGYTI